MRIDVDQRDARQHARLLERLGVVLAALDAFAAVLCHFTAPAPMRVVLISTLAGGALGCVGAVFLARRGARAAALALLVVNQSAVPAVITLLIGARDAYALMNLGAWLTTGILVAAAFATHRTILAIGGASVVGFVLTVACLHLSSPGDAADPLIFVLTAASLAAVVSRHRDALALLHETELQERNKELEALKRTLEDRVVERTEALIAAEKMAAIGRLTAGIAHELASPLGAILATTEHLRDLAGEYAASIGDSAVNEADHRAIANEMLEAASVAEKAAERSANFVRSIKSQTRVPVAGRREEFDVLALVADCVSLLAHAARAARCQVSIKKSAQRIVTCGAPNRLAQVVANLVQNAIDAAGDRGGGAIEVSVDGTPAAGLRIAVKDDAGGIPPEILARIFEPLFTTKPFGRGTGLGLSIVKEAVETDLGGRIHVQTEVGKGSTFVVELPPTSEERDAA